MKKRIVALALALAAATTATAPVFAEDGVVYKQTKHWTISAYLQNTRCIASTAYPGKDDDQILFGIDTKGWFLSLASRSANMEAGNQYKVSVVTSLGSSGTYIGRAISRDQIMIEGLSNADLYGWAKAKSINIVGRGTYNLTGSLDTIVSLRSCGDMILAMRSAAAPQATAPQAQEQAPAAQAPAVETPAPPSRRPAPQAAQSDNVGVLEL